MSSDRKVFTHARLLVPLPGSVRLFDERWAMNTDVHAQASKRNIRITPCDPFPSDALLEREEEDEEEDSASEDEFRDDLPTGVGKAIEHLVDLQKRAERSGRNQDWRRLEKLVQPAEFDRVFMKS
jgi:hypothetical protein